MCTAAIVTRADELQNGPLLGSEAFLAVEGQALPPEGPQGMTARLPGAMTRMVS